MTAWLFLAAAAAAWAVLSVLIGLLVGKWLSSPQGAGDDFPPRSSSAPVLRLPQKRELLSLLDERSVAAGLHPRTGRVQASPIRPPVTHLPCRYVDGSRDDVSRSLDVIADALAAPKEAAPDFPDAA